MNTLSIFIHKVFPTMALALLLGSCGTSSDHGGHTHNNHSVPVVQEELEIIGMWAEFGPSWFGTHVITPQKWEAWGSSSSIVEYSNETNTLITQQNNNEFSKVVWTEINNDHFRYCTVAYNQPSAEDAKNAEDTSDIDDLDDAGCGGNMWSPMTPAIEIHGDWASDWGAESINSKSWGATTIISYNNHDNSVITQNPIDDPYYPEKFSHLVWTDIDTEGNFYYCTIAYNQESAVQAAQKEDISNTADLEGEGCNGFPWTKLSPN